MAKTMTITGKATNEKTKATRPVVASLRTLDKASHSGVDRCSGPCQCRVEPDGHCPNGWPSRMLACGII